MAVVEYAPLLSLKPPSLLPRNRYQGPPEVGAGIVALEPTKNAPSGVEAVGTLSRAAGATVVASSTVGLLLQAPISEYTVRPRNE